MAFFLVKTTVTVVLVLAVSEIARRSSLAGGLLASIPLVSVLALVWLHLESGSSSQVMRLSHSVFWLTLPSLVLFLCLNLLLARGLPFFASLAASVAATVAAYLVMLAVLQKAGLSL